VKKLRILTVSYFSIDACGVFFTSKGWKRVEYLLPRSL
jgi:hypothetical protein